jgi:hypothetical protein
MFARCDCGGRCPLARVWELTDRHLLTAPEETRPGRGAAVGRAMEPELYIRVSAQTRYRRLHIARCAAESHGTQGTAARQPASLRVPARAQLFAHPAPGLGSGRVHVFRYAAGCGPRGAVACLDDLRAGTWVRIRSRSHVHAPGLSGGGRGGRGRAHRHGPGAVRPNLPKVGKKGPCGLPVSPSDASSGAQGVPLAHPARPTAPACTLPEHQNMSPYRDPRGHIRHLCPSSTIFSHPGTGTGTQHRTASPALTWHDAPTRFQNALTRVPGGDVRQAPIRDPWSAARYRAGGQVTRCIWPGRMARGGRCARPGAQVSGRSPHRPP